MHAVTHATGAWNSNKAAARQRQPVRRATYRKAGVLNGRAVALLELTTGSDRGCALPALAYRWLSGTPTVRTWNDTVDQCVDATDRCAYSFVIDPRMGTRVDAAIATVP